MFDEMPTWSRPLWGVAPPIVFKDALYIFAAADPITGTTNGIFKSTNGRDWSRVSGATPNYLNPTEDFPAKADHAAVVHDNKVWITGEETRTAIRAIVMIFDIQGT